MEYYMDIVIKCKLCDSKNITTLYNGPIRSGGVESVQYEDEFTVKKCGSCGVAFLYPFPNEIENYYKNGKYWFHHHDTVNIDKLQKSFDSVQSRRLCEIGMENLREKRIADFGCSAGLFLDLVSGIAAETIGVELAKCFQPYLESNGHRYVQYPEELEAESVDVAVSFDTLEHVDTPKSFLESINRVLIPGGVFFLSVPNQNDFLKKIVPAYLPFFYQRSHLFYFNATTLVNLLEEVGFRKYKVGFVHKYDLMNLVVWARDGKGQGKKGNNLFDRVTEDDFRKNLERQGIASHIFVETWK